MERFRLQEMRSRTVGVSFYHLEEKVGQRTDDWELVARVMHKGPAEILVEALNKAEIILTPNRIRGEDDV